MFHNFVNNKEQRQSKYLHSLGIIFINLSSVFNDPTPSKLYLVEYCYIEI